MYKYKTKRYSDDATLVLRTRGGWPKSDDDAEALVVEEKSAKEALKVAKATADYHWG